MPRPCGMQTSSPIRRCRCRSRRTRGRRIGPAGKRPSRWSSRPRPKAGSACSPAAAKAPAFAGRSGRGRGVVPQDRLVRRPAALRSAAGRRQLSQSSQPFVPERVFVSGGEGSPSGISGRGNARHVDQTVGGREVGLPAERETQDGLKEFAERITREAMESMQQAAQTKTEPLATMSEPGKK